MKRIAIVAITLTAVLSFSTMAMAAVERTYPIHLGQSKLVTPSPIGELTDSIADTGLTPTWFPAGSAVPAEDYEGQTPQETLNIIKIRFTNHTVEGRPLPGPIEVVWLDLYHNIDASIPGVILVTGLADHLWGNATGTLLADGTVDSWTVLEGGPFHTEVKCVNDGLALCGPALGLPADGDTTVAHANHGTVAPPGDTTVADYFIEELGGPGLPAPRPMTFTSDFSTVRFEITLVQDAQGTGQRMRYEILAGAGGLPAASPTGQIVLVVALAGVALFSFYRLRRTVWEQS